MISGMKK